MTKKELAVVFVLGVTVGSALALVGAVVGWLLWG